MTKNDKGSVFKDRYNSLKAIIIIMKFKSTFMAPLLVTVVMLLLAASRYIDLEVLSYQENICLAVIVIQIAILLVPSAFYAKLKGEGYVKKLRFAPFGIEKFLVTLLGSVTLILGDTLLKLAIYHISGYSSDYSVYSYYLNGASPGVLYLLITFAVMPAVCEEILFRSILCAEYESSGVVTAVIASAALYGMFGIAFGNLPVYFFSGLMFALVMYMSRSVFASMLCHLIYAVFNLAAGETVQTLISKPQSTGFLVFALGSLFLVCLAVFFGECERIYYGYALSGKKAEYADSCPKFSLKKFSEALLAPPFLVAILIFIVAAIQFGIL